MQRNTVLLITVVIAVGALIYTVNSIIKQVTVEAQEGMAVDVVRDTVQVILDFKRINAGDFIHLYDAAPYHIMNGHVALKMPCDNMGMSMPMVKVMAGNAEMGMFDEVEMVLLEDVSTKGKMCVWHGELESTHDMETAFGNITDVIIMNDNDRPIRFLPGSSIVVGVNEIMKGEHSGEHSGEQMGGH